MLTSSVKHILRKIGIELRRYRPDCSETAQLGAMLTAHGIDFVFDVGANIGQFAKQLRESGYQGRIVSFEPLSRAWHQLAAASQHDPQWDVAQRTALGCADGSIDIHVAGNDASSSVLPMLDAHSRAAPGSRYVGLETVPLRRLDSIAKEYLRSELAPFLKIDTQGYEDRVLHGAAGILERIVGVQLELSLVPLYEGQLLYDTLIRRLQNLGFELWALHPVFTDPRTGRLLQFDATLFRRCTTTVHTG